MHTIAKQSFRVALSIALLAASSLSNAALIRGAVSATASNELNSTFAIENTIDQSGLSAGYISGVTDFDTYIGGNPMHGINANLEWFTAQGVDSAVATYDLGGLFSVDRIALWNEDAAGIAQLDVLVSTDGVSFTEVLTDFLPADILNNTDYAAQILSFATTNAQFVRINMDACPQAPSLYNGCSMGEIAFSTDAVASVPEGATLALVALGLAGLRARRIRR